MISFYWVLASLRAATWWRGKIKRRTLTYCVDCVLHGLICKSYLINIKLLVHQVRLLSIVHLSASKHLESFLFESLQSCSFGSSHFFFDLCKLLVAFLYLSIDYFASLVHLQSIISLEQILKVMSEYTFAEVSLRVGALMFGFGSSFFFAVPKSLFIAYSFLLL